MTKKTTLLWITGISLCIILLGFGFYSYYAHSITIKSIELLSPNNYAFQEDIVIVLDKKAPVEIKFWKEGSPEKFRSASNTNGLKHTFHLLLLETSTTYKYQVIIKRLVNVSSKVLSFQTRKQSSWLEHNWVSSERPHDETSLAELFDKFESVQDLADAFGKLEKWLETNVPIKSME